MDRHICSCVDNSIRLTFSASHFTCDRFLAFYEQDCDRFLAFYEQDCPRSSLHCTFSSAMRDVCNMHHHGKGLIFFTGVLFLCYSFRTSVHDFVQYVFSDFTSWANTPEGVLKCELKWTERSVLVNFLLLVTWYLTDSILMVVFNFELSIC